MDSKRKTVEELYTAEMKKMRDDGSNHPFTTTTTSSTTIQNGNPMINSVFVFLQLIQGSIFLDVLDKTSLFQFTLISKDISTLVIQYIERNYTFGIYRRGFRELSIYKPICVTIDTFFPHSSFYRKYPSISQLKIMYQSSRIDKTLFKIDNTQCPSNITQLIFESTFNSPFDPLPHSLTHITFGNEFDLCVDGLLPPNLLFLVFGFKFQHSTDKLPLKLKHLTYGYLFDKPVNSLPPNLLSLTFDSHFSQLTFNLPSRITRLSYGHYYNLPIHNLPRTITHLRYGFSFNHSIDSLPPNILNLTLGEKFNMPIFSLPPNLVTLIFENHQYDHLDTLKSFPSLKQAGCKVYVRVKGKLQHFNVSEPTK